MFDDTFTNPVSLERDLIDLGGEKVVVLGADGLPDTTKKGKGCTPGQIWAIVKRLSPGARSPDGLPSPKVRLTAVADPVLGIDPATLNQSSEDAVMLAYPGRNSTPVRLTINMPSDGNLPGAKRASVDDGLTRLDLA